MFTQNQPIENDSLADLAVRPGDEAGDGFDPLQVVRRALRGMWGWVIALGVICGLVGALAGYMFEKPLYKSEGLLRIAYVKPKVITSTELSDPLPMYESFMRSEQLRMTSRNLVERALHDPAWIATGRGDSSSVVEYFADCLLVEHPAGTEHLRVSFTDHDPLAAGIAVNAVINAFTQSYNEIDQTQQRHVIELLTQRQDELRAQLKNIENEADAIILSETHGKQQSAASVQAHSDDLEVAESVLKKYMMDQVSLQDELASLRHAGFMDRNPKVIAVQESLDRATAMVAHYSDECRRLRSEAPAANATASTGPSDDASGNAVMFGAHRLELERLQGQGEMVRKQLGETTDRIQALQVESALGGRLEVISPGDVPLGPFRDRRRLLAGLGGMVGASLPGVILVFLGTFFPRYRYSDETESDVHGKTPLLGILPTLPEGMNDPERAASAAQCVHHMRVMLQVAARGKSRTYLVTSACAGEGKTSLTIALGLSFAASGSRTLVIDCDLIGRRLTHGFDADGQDGLYEALYAENPGTCIRQTVGGMWLLPVGRADAAHASTLSASAVERLLDEARKEFDVILIDSGPILGSVEASVVAPEVDGVIMTVSRGQQPALVDRMVRHLQMVGAKAAGMVFNRAKTKDFYRSAYGSAYRSNAMRSTPPENAPVPTRALVAEGLEAFGPLVGSVTLHLPTPRMAPHRRLETRPERAAG